MIARLAAVAVASAILGGCASGPPPVVRSPAAGVQSPAVAVPPPEVRAAKPPAAAVPDVRAGELIAYLAAVGRSGAAEQKKELAQAAAAFGREATPYARLKLGGLYAQPVQGLRDDARALALLEPLAAPGAAAGADRPIADLASLLYAQVAERQRLARDESKKQEALRERIEAMKSIERSIMQREERQRTVKRP